MKKVTLKDIAKKFNVSVSTVSKALKGSEEISKATRDKIKTYAEAINYRPNLNALSLKNRRTKTIGILVPDMLNYFLAQVLKGIEKTAIKHNYKVVICITNDSHNREIEIIEMLSNGSVDGFIISIAEETEISKEFNHFNNALAFNLPIVMFDRVANGVLCDKVITNNRKAGEQAVINLAESGCRKIGFASSNSHLKVSQDLLKGYYDGIHSLGQSIDEKLIIHKKVDHYSDYESMLEPLFEDDAIDGIIASNEGVALAAMKIAQQRGKLIPEDFSTIGFTNGILARHSNPKLTTVSQHGELMGAAAAEMLIERLEHPENKKEFKTKMIKTDIVERNSTKSVKMT
ncbi:MAG: LacI family DNA-binding transcriptional regulator [Flavobacteriaceae bacterium]|nr:LacI family DNA-binding transcriptional regulator [Flavobacteriaceae bacterium]